MLVKNKTLLVQIWTHKPNKITYLKVSKKEEKQVFEIKMSERQLVDCLTLVSK